MSPFSDIELIAIAYAVIKRKLRKRRRWVHPLNSQRLCFGQFHCMYGDLRKWPDKFSKYYSMSIASFDELLRYVRDDIQKRNTNCRKAISPEERLTVTLRYLTTGRHFSSLCSEFRIGRSTISVITRETCVAIWEKLQPTEMLEPTPEKWSQIAEDFYSRTNFPNCLGAVDGKLIAVLNNRHPPALLPPKSVKRHSVALIAVADANYFLTAVDVVLCNVGREFNVFKQSAIGKKLYDQDLNLPHSRRLPNSDGPPQPLVLVADEAFGVHVNLLRPFSNRNMVERRTVFNYRLHRARMSAECALGILSNKWKILHRGMLVHFDFVCDIARAACVLHNFVLRRDGYRFEDSLTCCMKDMPVCGKGNLPRGREVREYFTEYFGSPAGSVPWQCTKTSTKTKTVN